MEIKEGQLVEVPYLVDVTTGKVISTNQSYNYETAYKRDSNFRRLLTWVRVKFIDLDGTFVGEAERIERNMWSEVVIDIFKKGQQAKIDIDRVTAVEVVGKDFCYGDNVRQCNCTGLCRNK